MRIAIGGFQHETNTFAESRAGIEEFEMADAWPPLLTDIDVIEYTRGMNLPIAGAAGIDKNKLDDHLASTLEFIPTLWCSAEPSGYVSDEAFDHFSQMFINKLQQAGALDGVYLDLHGAMVTQSFENGETELLRRIRQTLGEELPIAVSLDLHANISPELVEHATLITVYQTYPHLDMAACGERCMQQLLNVIQGQQVFSAFRQIPFLIPLHAQYTGQKPCKELYQQLDDVTEHDGEWVDLALGFSAADVYHCGPSVVAYAQTQSRAEALADTIRHEVQQQQGNFDTQLLSTSDAITQAMRNTNPRPTVLADVQDNPGAGATSDTTGLLHALIKSRATGTVLGVFCDSQIADDAHHQGLNAVFHATLGGKLATQFGKPVSANFKVLALSDGNIRYSGEMYAGGMATLGPSCLLSVEDEEVDIKVVVSSVRIQCLDQALFTHFGIELSDTRIIGVKSTAHHRADFEPIASEVLNVAAPGAFACQLNIDDYQRLRNGVKCL